MKIQPSAVWVSGSTCFCNEADASSAARAVAAEVWRCEAFEAGDWDVLDPSWHGAVVDVVVVLGHGASVLDDVLEDVLDDVDDVAGEPPFCGVPASIFCVWPR